MTVSVYSDPSGTYGSIAVNGVEKLRLNADGSLVQNNLPAFMCRAWVVFDGTGTPTILGSGNVSSITKVGTGHYRVNFATPFADTNYCVTASGQWDTLGTNLDSPQCGIFRTSTAITTNYVDIGTVNSGALPGDCQRVCVTVFK